MGSEDLCCVPSAAVGHGKARQRSGTGPCGEFRRVLWVPSPRRPHWGKSVLWRNPGYNTRAVAMWLNVLGEIRFIEPQGVNGHRRPVPGAPSSGTPRESQAKLRNWTVWGL